MPDFTKALAAGLDARRKVFYGSTAKLVLLDHARPGRRGVDALLEVTRGWHLADADKGELPTLLIAELEPVMNFKREKPHILPLLRVQRLS
jgi:hypothetical protein